MRGFYRRAVANVLGLVGYDEERYWNRRPDPNTTTGWEPEHRDRVIAYLREQTEGCPHVLELGPGIGRTLEAHPRGRIVHGYDISGRYRDRLYDRAQELGLDVTLDVGSNARSALPYETRQFDAGIACQVLLHQRPENIRQVMRELIRVCNKVVVVTGAYRRSMASMRARHVFVHDYPAICTELACEMHHVRAYPPHLFFVYQAL